MTAPANARSEVTTWENEGGHLAPPPTPTPAPPGVTADGPRPRKHLMTPGQPRPPTGPNTMSTAQVQRWVTSVLIVAVVGHFAEALAVFALLVPEQPSSPRVGLLILAGITGVLTIGGVRIVHQRRMLSPWLILGLAPAAVSTYLAYLQ
jgi:hypothetical protein